MARRKRVKRKANGRNCQSSQPAGSSRKRNIHGQISEETHIQRKRRRTSRYNLRESNSVVLVGEIPCCQTLEQREKYTQLGLNSALFIKGSQRPKRKQSHISIITISSDDEETSEERTSEWVNSLGENYQSNVEPERSGVSENPEKKEQTFQPLCSSTPNSSRSTVRYQPDEQNRAKEFGTSTEALIGHVQEKSNEPQELGNLDSSPGSHTGPPGDQMRQEQTFQLVISIPDTLTDTLTVMQHQPGESNKAKMSGSLTSSESSKADQDEIFNKANRTDFKSCYQGLGSSFSFGSGFGSTPSSLFLKTPVNSGSGNLENVKTMEGLPAKVPCFYFGSSTDNRNVISTPVSPFESCFNNRMDTSTSGGFKFDTFSSEGQGETNQFDMPDTNSIKNANNQTESNSLNSDDSDISLEKNSRSNSS